ncbi:MAG: IMP cyclohydrolase [Oscillospiraceae bacterium]|nr:IMP cyclohydrolase [Oscillospiraceae bacterium]MBQ7082829.1 IMP cyclohydrolase [Oscillospiraceae bacterium]
MKKVNLYEYLSANEYPGRGIVLGRSADGEKMMIGYFIMGRSENSRNRVFVTEGEGIRTEAFDPSKLQDPSLIIYAPVRVLGENTIVTNGDQTDTIYDFMAEGKSFEDALRTREFEPDGPNYTPRISGVVHGDSYQLSILKSADGDPAASHRYFFDYSGALAGEGHVIHTYRENGNPIPSFEGEPVRVEMTDDFDAFGEKLWNALNEDNKVSLFVRAISLADGKTETRIYNKNK